MDFNKAVNLVIAALKKKKKEPLAKQMLEALGIDFSVDTEISDHELEQELNNIHQYLPEASTASVDDVITLVTDLFLTDDPVTSEMVETLATTHNLDKELIENTIYDITKTLWSAEAQVKSKVVPESVWDNLRQKTGKNYKDRLINRMGTLFSYKPTFDDIQHDPEIFQVFKNEGLAQVDEGAPNVVYSKQKLPAKDYPPAGISKRAAKWWAEHVWPTYRKAILKSEIPWATAVNILKHSCEKHGISCYACIEEETKGVAWATSMDEANAKCSE